MNGRILNGRILPVIRIGTALLAVAAIVAQLVTLANANKLDVVNFFSFFTIQSNLIGIAVLVLAARSGPRSRTLERWRGAASVYLTVTFVVVIALLQNVDVGLQLVWVDVTLHKIVPVVIVADYLLDPPGTRFSIRDGLTWLIYPLAWLAYTLIRGPLVSWYPYPFLDPDHAGGYGAVAVTSLVILVAGAALCGLYVWLGNRLGGDRVGGDRGAAAAT
jgi:hypothetical protein